jgi:sorting nexin-29
VEPIEYYENESRHALDESVEEPSYEEVSTIITNFRKSQAPGIDNINPEPIQTTGPQMNSRIYRLVTNIWTKEKMPKEWNLALICPIYKTVEKSECNNYRGISLLNIAYKIIAAVINKRLNQYAEDLIGESQNGFRNNRATTDNIFVMRRIFEKNVMNIKLNRTSYPLILSKLLTQ